MICERCNLGTAVARVQSDVLDMAVCINCAIDALPRLGFEDDKLRLTGGEAFSVSMDAYLTSAGRA